MNLHWTTCFASEMEEETGLNGFQTGPIIWMRRTQLRWDGRYYDQHESYFLIKAARFEPRIRDERESRHVRDFRWWNVRDVCVSSELFAPRNLWVCR